MSNADDQFDLDISTVISQPGGVPDPVAGLAPGPDGSGIRLGRYTTLRMLGKGGMAEVYLAKQDGPAGFQKTCVIKRMRRSLAGEQRFVDMFLREARVAARLNHANVVQIFELGEESGEYFIAMEYLDGISLHRAARRCWANETSMPMEVVLRSVADAAQGLHHAHRLRNDEGVLSPLVHRDISPDNLMVTRDGVCKVLDFGIAKSEGEDADLVTRTGELKGKIPFMSPEHIRGEPLDGRSDLWALGVTLYWLLTGKRPFDGGSDHMTIDHILRQEPENPRSLNPLIPQEVARMLLALLKKDVDERLSSGAEMHDGLVHLLGPAAGTGPSSSFVNEVMAMPATEKSLTPESVLTLVAARPATQWLKRVIDSDGQATLSSMIPPLGDSDPNLPPLALHHGLGFSSSAPDAVSTITGLNTAEIAAEVLGKNNRSTPIVAGIVAAVALFGLAFWLLGTREQMPPPLAELAPPIAARGAIDRDQALDKQNDGAEAKTAPAAAFEPSPPPVDPIAPSTEPPAKQPPTKQPAARASPPRQKVKASAPKTVTWKYKGRRVGRGMATLKLPPNAKMLRATDSRTGGVSEVAIKNGRADFSALARGALVLRVRPWAKVKLGNKTFGTTPLDSISLPAGRYHVTLTWKDKVKRLPVTIKRGGRAVLKVDMRK